MIMLQIPFQSYAFCGFYVAGADSKLFNETSEVILVRNNKKTVVTMKNDYQGNMEDFAMVVPIPNVIQRNDIKVVDKSIFATLDKYSAPRLVEYYDVNPCTPPILEKVFMVEDAMAAPTDMSLDFELKDEFDTRVTIEARYEVEEYDILVLSSKESSGLKSWLEENGYHLPKKAEEVLDPYIKNNMKFFVAKVDIQRMLNPNELSPIQITYEHDNLMLPIRLGMANSKGEQDLVVYAFTPEGRIECTNYRTVEMPTGNDIPPFVDPHFGGFYKKVFEKEYLDN